MRKIDRRCFVLQGSALTAATIAAGSPAAAATRPSALRGSFANVRGPRTRTIFVNDVAGDPDGLYAAVHQMLSTSSELRAVVGTSGLATLSTETAALSYARFKEMLQMTGLESRVKAYEGAPGKITAPGVPVRSPGTQAIIDEARRTDSTLPLYVAVGGGLTEVASALMLAPDIAERFVLVWIGGGGYPMGRGEFNFNLDPIAAQYIFNETKVVIWQIPSTVYSTCAISMSEIQAYVTPYGKLGRWLQDRVVATTERLRRNTGETWTLGDSPLVVLTALTDWVSGLGPTSTAIPSGRTGSSEYDEVFAPRLRSDGSYEPRSDGRKIRIYKSIDNRMMFNDMFAKMRLTFGD